MPRFFFNLRNDVSADDPEGQELPDVETACERAVAYTREMTAASVLENGKINLHHRIEEADESGAHVCTVEFGDVVTIEG